LSSQVSRIQNGKKKEIERLEEGFDPQHINEMIAEKNKKKTDTISLKLNLDINELEKYRLDTYQPGVIEKQKELDNLIKTHQKSLFQVLEASVQPSEMAHSLMQLQLQHDKTMHLKKLEGTKRL